MDSLIFRNLDNSIFVEIVTDLGRNMDNNFSVLQIKDLNYAESRLGLSFNQIEYNLQSFKEFAINNNLILERLSNENGNASIVEDTVVLDITNGATLPAVYAPVPYSVQLTSEGGNGTNKIWEIVDGSMPEGLSLDSVSGVISGVTEQVVDDFTFTISLTDGFVSTIKEFSLHNDID